MSNKNIENLSNKQSFYQFNSKNKDNLHVSRFTKITQEYLDTEVRVYNGIEFTNFLVKSQMIGHKFGEFAQTRKPCVYMSKKNKKRKKKK